MCIGFADIVHFSRELLGMTFHHKPCSTSWSFLFSGDALGFSALGFDEEQHPPIVCQTEPVLSPPQFFNHSLFACIVCTVSLSSFLLHKGKDGCTHKAWDWVFFLLFFFCFLSSRSLLLISGIVCKSIIVQLEEKRGEKRRFGRVERRQVRY